MSKYYADHGAYAAQGIIGAANPATWAVPQEGDGSGMSAATASAVAFISFSGAPASGTFQVCGVTVSTTGVIGAASADAAANTLATNINATTTAVAAGVATGVPALKNLVYARGPAGGAPAGTCEVMMRVGSAALNYANNTNCLLLTTYNTDTSTAGNKQFAGGSGGCWGYFINTATVGGSSATYTEGNFGLLSPAKPFVSVASGTSVLGEPTAVDTCFGRSGAGQTITLSTNISITLSSALICHFVLDSNTEWTGDSGTGVVTISQAISGVDVEIFKGQTSTTRKSVGCIKKESLRLYLRSTAAGGRWQLRAEGASNFPGFKLWNVLIEEAAGLASPNTQGFQVAGVNYVSMIMDGVRIAMPTARSTWPSSATCMAAMALTGVFIMQDCSIEANFTAITDPGPIFGGSVVGIRSEIRMTGNKFTGWASGNFKPLNITSGVGNANYLIENNTGLKIDSGTYLGLQADRIGIDEFSGRLIYRDAGVGATMRDESCRGSCDWVYGASYPVLRALQEDGTTLWSLKMFWPTTAYYAAEHQPLRTIPLSQKYREAAATKTITLECYIPDALTVDPFAVVMRVEYIDSDGYARSKTSKGVASAYSASGLTWTNTIAAHSAKKFALTTDYSIEQNTFVTAYLEFHRSAPTSNQILYVDPEFAFS